ncbi:hypothetical protein M9H77_29916 [Catharanthus roseus]|uniref:Uncharacterized protein n=1 Tax=Catharanthus roseus TaxID=4058 RepID=A0ACB9ZWJ1_CATRO|nr:hypothetical protein M9H77_29916 [Catharanthus roseus]
MLILVLSRTRQVELRGALSQLRLECVRGRHSTSNLPVTPTPLAPGFHHGTGEAGYSTQQPTVPFRSRPLLQPHLSHTPVPYELYESAHPPSHPTDTVYDPYLYAPTVMRPRIPYRYAIQEPILEFRGQPRRIGVEFYQMLGATPQDSSCSTHGIVGEEQERVRSLHIQREADERGDDDGDGDDDDQDNCDDDGDEE